MKKLQKAYPFYVKYTIPANTYSGQSTQVETLGVKSILLASDNLSDETVKEITRLLFKHGKDMQYATSLNLNLDEKTPPTVSPSHFTRVLPLTTKIKVLP